MTAVHPMRPTTVPETRDDAIATAALIVIRRALVEGVPVSRTGLAEAASIALGASPEDAVRELKTVPPEMYEEAEVFFG